MKDRYLVFGNPIAHSWSPAIHAIFAREAGLSIEYDRCLVESEFETKVRDFFVRGGKGANVTLPFKEDAMRMVEVLTDRAKMAGAVNTLYMREGRLTGDNTDGKGFVADIRNQFGTLDQATILLIGAGGAARGVIKPLLDDGVASIAIANRTDAKSKLLAAEFATYGNVVSKSLSEVSDDCFDIIVNCTSSSVHNELPGIEPDVFSTARFAYDMYYRNEPTVFMSTALKNNPNLQVSDGLGMLIGQAAESFRIWTGYAPDVSAAMILIKREMFA